MPLNASTRLESLIRTLPSVRSHHAPTSALYLLLKQVARDAVEELFRDSGLVPKAFLPFGDVVFPYHRMGAVDSLNLFDLDELILFSFYWANRGRYRRVLDIGANIGLHSIVLSRCGYEVRAYEPDPEHVAVLERNLVLNGVVGVEVVSAAVSSGADVMEFVRVLGNTTGSHLSGAKPHPYGELQRFPVRVDAFTSLLPWADLIKMDVEGHEREILLSTTRRHWQDRDALVEVGSPENAAALYAHFKELGVHLFSQKTGWGRVRKPAEMPTSYREGSLFVSCRQHVPWSDGRSGLTEKRSSKRWAARR